MNNSPTATVLINSCPPFSRKTVCSEWSLADWSPSIWTTSSLDLGALNLSNVLCRSQLESIIGPVTSLMGRRRYLNIHWILKLFKIIIIVGLHNIYEVGISDWILSKNSLVSISEPVGKILEPVHLYRLFYMVKKMLKGIVNRDTQWFYVFLLFICIRF